MLKYIRCRLSSAQVIHVTENSEPEESLEGVQLVKWRK